jgi:hypothetical protein
VAFLNSLGDGVVVTTVVSRDFARMYVKLLKDGQPDVPLAPEEAEALEQAKGTGPFTIRPRVDIAAAGIQPEAELAAIAPDEPVSLGLPGRRPRGDRELARENRRRKRQGLSPLDEEVVPSAVGWKDARTPGAAERSLADQYLSERRTSRRRPGSGDGDHSVAVEESEAPDEL